MIPVFTNYRLIIHASDRFFLEILFPAVIITPFLQMCV